MDSSKIGGILLTGGIIGVGLSVFWWLVFYAQVAEAFGDRRSGPPLQCLFSNSGPCGFITGIANARGALAYNPMLLWLSAAVAIAGVVVKATAVNAPPVSTQSSQSDNRRRFEALLPYDDDLKRAATEVAQLGDKWSEMLANEYMTINSKEYLSRIVARIKETARLESIEMAEPAVIIEEGVYRNRKWRRLKSGKVEGELAGGRMKEFASLDEWKRYISRFEVG